MPPHLKGSSWTLRLALNKVKQAVGSGLVNANAHGLLKIQTLPQKSGIALVYIQSESQSRSALS